LRHVRVALLATLMASQSAVAQVSGAVDLSNALGRAGTGPWLRESRFAPELRHISPFSALRFSGLIVERAGTISMPASSAQLRFNTPSVGAFSFALSDSISRYSATTVGASNLATASLTARLGATAGVWGGGVHASGRDAAFRLGAQLGAWRTIGVAIVSLTSTTMRDRFMKQEITTSQVGYIDSFYTDTAGWHKYNATRTVSDSARVARMRGMNDVQARVDFGAGRLMFVATLARRTFFDSAAALNARPVLWGGVNAVVRVTPHLALVAGAGALPPLGREVTTSSFASLGVRLSPAALLRPLPPPAVRAAATTFALIPLGGGVYRVTMRVPSARTVEISGDFNQWTALALTETSPNVWEITLPLAAGTHHVNVRVDGARWIAPPGVPSIDDEFNGRVGILATR